MAVRRKNRYVRRASRAGVALRQKPLFVATDHGRPVRLPPKIFSVPERGGYWGVASEPFFRLNEQALALLDARVELTTTATGPQLQLVPGGKAGAVPLREVQTGRVVAGLVVRPRFGWSGVGSVLAETGWHAAPKFADLPLVPGSGREVPPWVLAGPIIARLGELLRHAKKGFRITEETLLRPRGKILWAEYNRNFASGKWHHLPCRFPELSSDPELRRLAKWSLERVKRDLVAVGGEDPLAMALAMVATRMLGDLTDVTPLTPGRDDLRRRIGGDVLLHEAIRRGVEAMAWIVEERGLGGGREQDGLAWYLPLDELWESYVESALRTEAAMVGAELRTGRQRQTTFPILWTNSYHRSLGHLVPDFILRRGRTVTVVDAKYKAHFSDIDEEGWRRMADEVKHAHRADLHQVLAYASLFDADSVTARLVYPLRRSTWRVLRESGRDVSAAELTHGGRQVQLELVGMPFGGR